jgi:Ulp1 family protease
MNKHAAKLLFNALSPLVPPKLKLREGGDGDDNGGGAEKKFACPQQENNYDCGMMVLAIAEILCERVNTKTIVDFNIDSKEVGARELDIKRRAIHTLISKKALEKQKAT